MIKTDVNLIVNMLTLHLICIERVIFKQIYSYMSIHRLYSYCFDNVSDVIARHGGLV